MCAAPASASASGHTPAAPASTPEQIVKIIHAQYTQCWTTLTNLNELEQSITLVQQSISKEHALQFDSLLKQFAAIRAVVQKQNMGEISQSVERLCTIAESIFNPKPTAAPTQTSGFVSLNNAFPFAGGPWQPMQSLADAPGAASAGGGGSASTLAQTQAAAKADHNPNPARPAAPAVQLPADLIQAINNEDYDSLLARALSLDANTIGAFVNAIVNQKILKNFLEVDSESIAFLQSIATSQPTLRDYIAEVIQWLYQREDQIKQEQAELAKYAAQAAPFKPQPNPGLEKAIAPITACMLALQKTIAGLDGEKKAMASAILTNKQTRLKEKTVALLAHSPALSAVQHQMIAQLNAAFAQNNFLFLNPTFELMVSDKSVPKCTELDKLLHPWAKHIINTGESATSVIEYMFNPDLQDELQAMIDAKNPQGLALKKQMQEKTIACPQFFEELAKLEGAMNGLYIVLKASQDKRSAQVLIKKVYGF
jgi:hypothetical protein